MKRLFTGIALAALAGATVQAQAQTVFDSSRDEVARSAATLMVGSEDTTSLDIVMDMVDVVASEGDVRLVPMMGQGGPLNLTDLFYFDNLDMAFVQSDALYKFLTTAGNAHLASDIHYIARMHNEEVHLVAPDGIGSVRDLDGLRVAVGPVNSGPHMTAEILFDAVGVDVELVPMPQEQAYGALKDGRVDAVLDIEGKPITPLAESGLDPDRFGFVPLEWEGPLEDIYLPTKLTHDDYPGLIEPDEEVASVAAMTVLTSWGWEKGHARYDRVARFVDVLFDSVPTLADGTHHPKWASMNLASDIPGWTRFREAQEWLDANGAPAVASFDVPFPREHPLMGDDDTREVASTAR